MKIRTLLPLLLAISFSAPPATSAGTPPRAAPSFHLATAHGDVALDSLRGKVVLIDFWASWCAPCARSFPWMNALHDSLASKGLEIVAVDLDKDPADADAFLAQHPPRFTIAFDPGGKTAEAYHVTAMPSSFVVDPHGSIVYAHRGFDPKKTGEIEAIIRKECPR